MQSCLADCMPTGERVSKAGISKGSDPHLIVLGFCPLRLSPAALRSHIDVAPDLAGQRMQFASPFANFEYVYDESSLDQNDEP